MRSIAFLALCLVLALPGTAGAHGPTRQKIVGKIEIQAPAAAVWEVVKDFGGMARWHPDVKEVRAEGGNAPGATRVLIFEDGGVIEEKLEKYDAQKMSFFYRITEVDVNVLPVTNYSSWFSVKDKGDGTSIVEWKGAFYRGFMGNSPPPELNNDAAKAAVDSVYSAGLESLKKIVEGH